MFLSERLGNSYLQTTYRVNGADEIVDIRIGVRNDALDRLLETYKATEWVFVTASNPGSRLLPERENAKRNAVLVKTFEEAGLRFLGGVGVPDKTGWKPEQSYLVLGVSKSDAMAMASRWDQCAIVWGCLRNPPELLWNS